MKWQKTGYREHTSGRWVIKWFPGAGARFPGKWTIAYDHIAILRPDYGMTSLVRAKTIAEWIEEGWRR